MKENFKLSLLLLFVVCIVCIILWILIKNPFKSVTPTAPATVTVTPTPTVSATSSTPDTALTYNTPAPAHDLTSNHSTTPPITPATTPPIAPATNSQGPIDNTEEIPESSWSDWFCYYVPSLRSFAKARISNGKVQMIPGFGYRTDNECKSIDTKEQLKVVVTREQYPEIYSYGESLK